MTGFFSNKGAMAAVFTCAGILLLLLGGLIHMAWQRKKRRRRQEEVTSRRMRTASAFSYVIETTPIARPSPSLHFSFGGISDRLWNGQKRRSGIFSQDTQLGSMERMVGSYKEKEESDSIIGSGEIMLYRPSGDDSELGHIYGRVRGIDTPPPPSQTPFSPPYRPSQSPPQSPPPNSPPSPPRRAISRGRSFTLEDALLPAISSASYTSHSPPLRHPYAQ